MGEITIILEATDNLKFSKARLAALKSWQAIRPARSAEISLNKTQSAKIKSEILPKKAFTNSWTHLPRTKLIESKPPSNRV